MEVTLRQVVGEALPEFAAGGSVGLTDPVEVPVKDAVRETLTVELIEALGVLLAALTVVAGEVDTDTVTVGDTVGVAPAARLELRETVSVGELEREALTVAQAEMVPVPLPVAVPQ